ncbi:unnamed protein product [Clavelina lepadiformis]|uniref:Sulfotransferase n=1 Tax=Clavelina lepadiformis TaxID=159417 RepID=A0ABP0F492_CLALP
MEELQSTGLLTDKQMETFRKLKETFATKLGQTTKGEVLKGYNIIPNFSVETTEYAYEKWSPREGDVFLVTFPKTGTHWVHEIVRQILYQDEEIYKLSKLLPAFLELPLPPCEVFDFLDELPLTRRILSTHMPAELINVEKLKHVNAKVIYVLRNPKDAIVSWYHFMQSLPADMVKDRQHMHSSGWDKYFEHVISGDYPMNSKPGEWYPEHILEWYKHKDYKNIRFLRYEDLKKDLQKEVLNLADFLEAPVSSETAETIAHKCTFDNMKEALSEEHAITKHINMRKGAVGGWKNFFTVAQSEQVDDIMREKLAATDIQFIYKI